MHFSDRLGEQVKEKGSSICVGYDPRFDLIPDELKTEYGNDQIAVINAFGKIIIDQVYDLVPIIKFQWAFFVQHGPKGIECLIELLGYAKEKELLTIVDAKVGDIGSTSEAYAYTYLSDDSEIGCVTDALTLNPFLGADTIEPFVKLADKYEKGLFLLVKTSNPGSKDIQDIPSERGAVYIHIAQMVDELGKSDLGDNGLSNVGAVVGATYPEHATILREKMPHSWFLVPGYGAQGGTLDTIKPTFMVNGLGALIVSARGINYAFTREPYKKLPYKEAIRKATEDMYAEISVFQKKAE